MCTRRTVRENLYELLKIIYQIPTEISDIHRNTCHKIIGEIKQLICLQYVHKEGEEILDQTPRLTHLHRPNSFQDYMEFNFKIQKADGAFSYALQPDRMYIRGIRDQVRQQRDYNQCHATYEWRKHERKISLLGNYNDKTQEKIGTSYSEALIDNCPDFLEEIQNNFEGLTVEKYNAEEHMFQLNPNNSNSTLLSSDNSQNSSNMSEYTLASSSSTENSIPSYEDLMTPE